MQLLFVGIILCIQLAQLFASMPPPWTRQLKVTTPYQTGNDVLITQTLVNRDNAVNPKLTVDGVYGSSSATAITQFQTSIGLKGTGIVDETTAQKLLDLHSDDGITDSGFTAESKGYLYKIHIPVHKNRSVETMSTLYDAKGNVLLTFQTRTHGKRGDGTTAPWPDFGNGDVGLNEFTSSGNTVTGIVEIDLNSPEPDPDVYGPWPINRIVRGLDGNALLLLPNIRDGLLVHTGNWTTNQVDWNESMDMPNSSGCIHGHPSDVEKIYKLLVKNGVQVNPNTFSGKNYPYKPQGIGVIELID